MKKFLTILSVIALACACTNNEETNPVIKPNQGFTVTASTEANTRIESTDGLQFNFKTDDQIGLFFFDDNDALVAENVCFKVASVDAGKATFEKVGSLTADELAKAAKVYAYYPYAEGKAIDENGKLAFEIPAVQTQTAKGDFTHLYDAYTMVSARTAIAKNDESASVDLKFSGIFSLVRFNVSNGSEDTVALKSIVMTAEDGHLAGNFAVDTTTDPAFSGINVGTDKSYTDPLIVTETSDSNSNTITVAFKEAVEVAANESVMLYGLVYANNSDNTAAVTTYANPNIVATTTTDDEYTLTKSVAKYILPRNQRTTFKMPLNGDDKVVARINGKGYSSLNDAIKVANGNSKTIKLLAGNTFTLPSDVTKVTFDGGNAEDVTIDIADKLVAGYDNITFQNVTFEVGQKNYSGGFNGSGKLIFKNCIINGKMFGYGVSEDYRSCTFNQNTDDYNMWTYGANVAYKSCTFNCNGRCIHVYNEGINDSPLKIAINNCKFYSTKKEKAALNIKTICDNGAKLKFNVVVDKYSTTDGNFDTTYDENGLWAIDAKYDGTQNVSVTYNSTEVYKVNATVTTTTETVLSNVLNGKNCTAVVENDMTISSILIDSGVSSTLELKNGCTISSDNTSSRAIGSSKSWTLKGEGTIVAPKCDTDDSSAIRQNGGTLTIEDNVKIEGVGSSVSGFGHPCVRVMKGTVNITGGYFHAGKDADGSLNACILLTGKDKNNKAILNISGGVFDNEGGAMCINVQDTKDGQYGSAYNTVNITGGIFIGFDPSVGDSGAGIETFVAKDYKSQETTYEGKQAWEVVPDTTTAE